MASTSLERLLASGTSDEVVRSMSWKRSVSNGRRLFEVSGQAPSPSKDWIQLKITDKGVIWRKCRISIRGVTLGKSPTPQPSEVVLSYNDFQYDHTMQVEVERVFGSTVLQQVRRIVAGNYDNLSCLPDKVLIAICLYLDLSSLTQLSRVSSHVREVCGSEALWERLYKQHQGCPSQEVVTLAADIGWKTVFFMNKLQLQKEVSRRRRLHYSPEPTNTQ